jgi:hypothetical protein
MFCRFSLLRDLQYRHYIKVNVETEYTGLGSSLACSHVIHNYKAHICAASNERSLKSSWCTVMQQTAMCTIYTHLQTITWWRFYRVQWQANHLCCTMLNSSVWREMMYSGGMSCGPWCMSFGIGNSFQYQFIDTTFVSLLHYSKN